MLLICTQKKDKNNNVEYNFQLFYYLHNLEILEINLLFSR